MCTVYQRFMPEMVSGFLSLELEKKDTHTQKEKGKKISSHPPMFFKKAEIVSIVGD